MLIKEELLTKMVICLICLVLTMVTLAPIALANVYINDSKDLWNTIEEFEQVSSLRKFLLERDWISENVSIDELDYILVLTQQLSSEFFPNVPTPLVLAVISFESGFETDLIGFNEDTGLMQIVPQYHKERIEKYIYNEKVTLCDPRLNIMVGMDYLEELLELSEGDLRLAIMGYNMGPRRASDYYEDGSISRYGEEVMRRMDIIQSFFEGRR